MTGGRWKLAVEDWMSWDDGQITGDDGMIRKKRGKEEKMFEQNL